MITGKTITECRELTVENLIEALDGVPPDKLHCPALAIAALQDALAKCNRQIGQALAMRRLRRLVKDPSATKASNGSEGCLGRLRGNVAPNLFSLECGQTSTLQVFLRSRPPGACAMPTPRSRLVDASITPWYHCISRCVRCAFLCGDNHAHRKQWIGTGSKSSSGFSQLNGRLLSDG